MLRDIRIASPCSADWEKMAGDDRVRFCAECNLNVYNFSALRAEEVEQLLANRTGRVCARFYRRTDGTMLTKDCPVGWRVRVRRISRVAGTALAAAIGLSLAEAQNQPAKSQNRPSDNSSLVQIDNATHGILVEVVDETGAFISTAGVKLVGITTENETRVAANDRGRVEFGNLRSGEYTVEASAPGFKTTRISVSFPKQRTVRVALPISANMGVVVDVEVYGVQLETSDLFRNALLPLTAEPSQQAPPTAPKHHNPLMRLLSKIPH